MEQLGIIKNSFFVLLFLISCVSEKQSNVVSNSTSNIKKITPHFNSDSAFVFIEKQVQFGPRVPNSLAHENCYHYLA